MENKVQSSVPQGRPRMMRVNSVRKDAFSQEMKKRRPWRLRSLELREATTINLVEAAVGLPVLPAE